MKAEYNLGGKRATGEVIKSNHHTVIVETPDTIKHIFKDFVTEVPSPNHIKRHKIKHNIIIKG